MRQAELLLELLLLALLLGQLLLLQRLVVHVVVVPEESLQDLLCVSVKIIAVFMNSAKLSETNMAE